uniref:Putative fatty acid hydroxylase domain-containing protein 2 n=1 Tax=Culex tarsalis TaxID=7177 RepID=A0A1Q3FKA3_CULTA
MSLGVEIFDLPARHFRVFWGASGDLWQSLWDRVLDVTGDDPFRLWIFGTLLYTMTLYWTIGTAYTLLDVFNRPAFLRRYKVQPGTNEPVDRDRLFRVIRQVVFNQIFTGLPMLLGLYWVIEPQTVAGIRTLPTFPTVVWQLAVCIVIEEFGFYYSHRLLHDGRIYKYIHKQHHEWTAPIAITAIYCHPVEHVFSNLVPPFLGIFMLGSHVAVAWLWFTLVILSTLNAHSGYHLPFFPSPEAHDFHHLKFNQCFGVLGVLDRLHGTDTLFRNTKAYARHIMMLSFMPAREAFPEPAKKAF